ncbi:unnamed protein product [Blepharisma stoltei]|uniref:HTH CENPB-type domain-containing protein n=1 Tax=Blepharisma stoltei TaxID=1481888 RepID=A0AAU9K3B2_9CILI|nr:unnamed protein product [Blepharisma stoltei]
MSMRDVAAKFHVNSFSSISEWVNKLDELKKSVKSDKKLKLESFTQFPELEKELVHWFTAIREQGIQVLRSTIEEKAKSLAAEMGLARFGCGDKWWQGFRTRNNLSFRKINASSIKPIEKEAELVRQYLDDLASLLPQFVPSNIYNFDETRFDWDVKSKFTYDFKGTQRILGVQSAKMNHFITVMLMIRADGEKMPALLIFQEKNGQIPNLVRERLNIPENVIIKSNKSGYISDQILNDYLRTILRGENQLLIYDQAGSHKTIMISNAISDLDATKIVIPGGCTKYLQPLDALVIANFKSKTTDFRIKFQTEQIERRSKRTGNLKALDRQQLINIASKAWDAVSPQLVRKSFELTGSYGVNHPKIFSHQVNMKKLII